MMSPSYTQDCRAHVGVWARALVKKGTDDGPLDVEEGEPETQAAQELRRRQFHGTWCYSDKPSCKSPKDLPGGTWTEKKEFFGEPLTALFLSVFQAATQGAKRVRLNKRVQHGVLARGAQARGDSPSFPWALRKPMESRPDRGSLAPARHFRRVLARP